MLVMILRGRLHESGLAANLDQVDSPGQPFASQLPVTLCMNPLSDPGQPFLLYPTVADLRGYG